MNLLAKTIVAIIALALPAVAQSSNWVIEDVTDPMAPVTITNKQVGSEKLIQFTPNLMLPEGCFMQVIGIKHLYIGVDGTYNEANVPVTYGTSPAGTTFGCKVPSADTGIGHQLRIKYIIKCGGEIISHHEFLLDII